MKKMLLMILAIVIFVLVYISFKEYFGKKKCVDIHIKYDKTSILKEKLIENNCYYVN